MLPDALSPPSNAAYTLCRVKLFLECAATIKWRHITLRRALGPGAGSRRIATPRTWPQHPHNSLSQYTCVIHRT